jgi:hypothetical protein
MITCLGNGWAELSFSFQKNVNDKPTIWRTYGRVILIKEDKSKVLVEYYDMEQNEVRKIFDYE